MTPSIADRLKTVQMRLNENRDQINNKEILHSSHFPLSQCLSFFRTKFPNRFLLFHLSSTHEGILPHTLISGLKLGQSHEINTRRETQSWGVRRQTKVEDRRL